MTFMGIKHATPTYKSNDPAKDVSATAWNENHTIDDASIAESKLALTDNTIGNVSTAKHGLVPKAPNVTSKFLRGDATWDTPAGSGDMTKAVYDTNLDNTVDDADKVDGEHAAAFADAVHTHVEADVTDLDHDAVKIQGKPVNDAAIGNDKILVYKTATGTLVYEAQGAGAGVNSVGEYGDGTTLTGDVKIQEGTNITITRSDPNNSLIITSSGGTGATYKPAYRYVIYTVGGTFYVYDNWDEAFELSAGTFGQLITTYNSLVSAGAGASFFWRTGDYVGSSATPFTVAQNKPCINVGEHMYYTYVSNTYSAGTTFKIQDADWSYARAYIFYKNMRIGAASTGIAIDAYQTTNNDDVRLILEDLNLYYPKIGVRYYNPFDNAYFKNLWIASSDQADTRGIIIANNSTTTNYGNFSMYSIHTLEHPTNPSGHVGLEITSNISGNTKIINLITITDLECLGYAYTADSIGVLLDGQLGGVGAINFIGGTLESPRTSFRVKGYAHGLGVQGMYCGTPLNTDKFWHATGVVNGSTIQGCTVQPGSVDESGKTDNFDYPTVFKECKFMNGSITPARSTKFINCGQTSYFLNKNCFVNGMTREASAPTVGYYQPGEICHRTDNNTFYIKDSAGVMRQIA